MAIAPWAGATYISVTASPIEQKGVSVSASNKRSAERERATSQWVDKISEGLRVGITILTFLVNDLMVI